MKNLIGMTDFVLEKNKAEEVTRQTYIECRNYANFLKQPLELWMFVPCDDDGNVLEKPYNFEIYDSGYSETDKDVDFTECFNYQQAKERCLFEGIIIKTHNRYSKTLTKSESTHLAYSVDFNFQFYGNCKIIEDLVKYNLELTQTAIKQLSL